MGGVIDLSVGVCQRRRRSGTRFPSPALCMVLAVFLEIGRLWGLLGVYRYVEVMLGFY